jgi:hypothetical protein
MTAVRVKVLILGGYGTFGGRLVRLLADDVRLVIVVAGRSKAQAEKFCAQIASKAELLAVAFDRDGDVATQLARIQPDIVVDASGPFQDYGTDPYRIVRTAIARGIHYIDLADGAAFVMGIAALDDEARRRGVFALSGASSVPVLTAAAVRYLAKQFPPITEISGGIASSPHAGLGLSVMRAIASYAGKPVALLHDGKPAIGYALIDSRRITIAPPGRLGLKNIRFSLVDVPDLKLLPEQWPHLRAVWFGAGPRPALAHRMLSAFAWLVRLSILPSLSWFAGFMHRVSNVLRWASIAVACS